eukprot:TRINITY_DN1680_c0_g1_i1.p1 TRINITY_DN1680_c0_g1~~TRINITY_DN1680_c0_g1_i1.p1  ORF type:complete len:660 (+),score=216.75 TRINITY_DN1680_c0_g1_i1:72-2051(+)
MTTITTSAGEFSPKKIFKGDKLTQQYERGIEFLKSRSEKIAQTEYEKEKELTRELQKTPQISKTSRQLIVHRPKDFSKANLAWQKAKERRLEETRQQILNAEAEKNTFKPNLKFYHKTEKRLSIFDDWDEQTAHYMSKKQDFLDKNCTFSPKIDRKSSQIAKRKQNEDKEKMEQNVFVSAKKKQGKSQIEEYEQHAGNRLWMQYNLDEREKLQKEMSENENNRNSKPILVDEDGTPLFRPVINPTIEELSEDNVNNVKTDVFEKLFSSPTKTPMSTQKSDEKLTYTPTLCKKSENIVKEKNLKPVFERLTEDPFLHVSNSGPNKYTIEDTQKSPNSEMDSTYEKRMKEFEERSLKTLEEKQAAIDLILKERKEEEDKQCTFKPELSIGTQEILRETVIDRKDLYDRAMDLEKHKLEEIEHMRKKRLADEVKDCTFKPITSKNLEEMRRKKLREEKQRKQQSKDNLSFMEKKRITQKKTAIDDSSKRVHSNGMHKSPLKQRFDKNKSGYKSSDWSYTSAALTYFKDKSPSKSSPSKNHISKKTPNKGINSPLRPINMNSNELNTELCTNSNTNSPSGYSSITSELYSPNNGYNNSQINISPSSPLKKRDHFPKTPISSLSPMQSQELKNLSESDDVLIDTDKESKKEHVLSMLEQWKSSR